ncbi:MAG TPA: hypothetical protein VM901_07960 [Bdellovibrionota bacterium]|nr:hypothetical protein [Bdellovibrionota bacterium]
MTEEEKIDRTPVAKDIWCWSTKEKAFTWHVVVNHDAQGYVDRVQCKVSKVIHKYKRLAKSKAAPKTTATRSLVRKVGGSASSRVSSATPTSSAALEDVWFRSLKKWGEKPVPKFDPKVSFDIDDVLEHVSFGKGVVQKRRDNKIEVLFRAGIKVLPSAK